MLKEEWKRKEDKEIRKSEQEKWGEMRTGETHLFTFLCWYPASQYLKEQLWTNKTQDEERQRKK